MLNKSKKITTLFLDIGGVLLSGGWGHEFRHMVQMFTDIAADMGIKSIRHINWQSTSEALTGMGLHIEDNKLVDA